MPEETKSRPINWGPVITIGAVAGGAALIIWLLTRGESEDKELAREILDDWQVEFDGLKDYVERIYGGGRTPTEGEIGVMSQMLDAMSLKEQSINQLSKSVWQEAEDIIKTAAQDWWLVPVVIFTPIAGWATYKILRGWFNNRRPPGAFPCPIDGQVFSTAEHLRQHMESEHPVRPEGANDAQAVFNQTSSWTQNAIAVESYLSQTYNPWYGYSIPQLRNLSWTITSAWAYSISAIAEMALLRTALMFLLI